MAIPWLAAFKVIPWRDVVTAAPSILEGTKKLWNSVNRTEEQAPPAEEPVKAAASTQPDPLVAIGARLRALESRTTEMAREAVSSAELLRSLAEQNSQLVKAVEILRLRTRKLIWFTVVLGVAGFLLFVWVMFRG